VRLKKLLRKEITQFFRHKYMIRMALFMPIFQTVILSFAANTDVVRVPVVVCDQDATRQSRELVEKIDSTVTFDLLEYEMTPAGVERQMETSAAEIGMLIPKGFARDLEHGGATVQVLVNGADSTTAMVAGAYIGQVASGYDRQIRTDLAERRGLRGQLPSIQPEMRVLYNPDLRSMWFMAPGVMAMVLLILMQNFAALTVARERELGTLEQLMITPAKPWEILLAKLIPLAVVGLLGALTVSLLVHFGLGVPLRGSLVALGTASVCFLFASLGLGLWVSTISANQQQAQMMNFFLIFPSTMLSGFIFPVSNLPPLLWWVGRFVPMTYYLEVIRGVFLRGSGLGALFAPQIVPLAALAAAFFLLGASRFRKRLD
jgi:ABC-2 type transport system permease protein